MGFEFGWNEYEERGKRMRRGMVIEEGKEEGRGFQLGNEGVRERKMREGHSEEKGEGGKELCHFVFYN